MAKQKKASTELMAARVVTWAVIAYALVLLNIATNYVVGLLFALPITMLLDKYIVKHVNR